MIYYDSIIFQFSRQKELKIYILIEGKEIKDSIPLPFIHQHIVRQHKMNKAIELWYKS